MSNFDVLFTEEGIRNTKPARLSTLDSELISDSYMRNTVKEELILEYVDHFRAQFVQLYPFRSPLLLNPPNEVGVPKFICTTLRPTQPPLRELYDLSSCARFVSSYIRYEPLDPPTELPKQLPSPATTLTTRTGDCFDMAIVLASYLIGNGYDAYIVVGTAPKWITLKQAGLLRYEFTEPSDALDRKGHTSPAALQIMPLTTTTISNTTSSSSNSTAENGNKYKLPPLASLESEFLKNRVIQEKETNTKLSASVSYESESENSDQELNRLRDGKPQGTKAIPAYVTKNLVSSDTGSSTETPMEDVSSTDPLHGQRIHAWVVVREGKREIDAPCFVEPSTGSIYSTKDSPYLAVESVFNHKNLWINMQAQPLIPHQELDKGSPLAPLLRNALNVKSHQQSIKGKGGMIAASAVTSTLAGTMRQEMQASVRSEMLSPYMSALSAMKQAQLIELNENVKRRAREKAAAKDAKEDKEPDPPEAPLPPGQYPVGAPVLRGPAAMYTMKNPRPPKPKEVPVPVVKTKTPKPTTDENSGENSGENATEGGATTEGENTSASSDGNNETGETTAPADDTAAATTEGNGAPEANTVTIGRPPSSKPGTANSTLRPSQSRPGTRARSQGGHRPSARPWKEYLSDQTDELNEQLADVLATEMGQLPTVNELQWDLQNSDCWEFCFLPYEKLPDDNEIPEGDGSAVPPSNVAGESKDGDHKEETENAKSNENADSNGTDSSTPKETRTGSANVRSSSAKPKKDKYANLQIELDGEHLLDLPPSWSEPLSMDAVKARQAIDATAGNTINYYKARLQRFQMHNHSEGLILRFTSYADSGRILPTKVVEVFARRKDGLFKRVRYITKPNKYAIHGQGTGLQIIEEHFDRGKQSTGLGMIVEELGKRRDMYFYTGSRIDGLLLRTEIFGKKLMEFYSPVTTNHLWYRSVTFANEKSIHDHHHHESKEHDHHHHDRAGSAGRSRKGPAGTVNGVLSVEVEHKLEIPLRKMAEKYRRDPSKPAYADANKIVYSMEDNTITIKYHTAAGKIAHATRTYTKPSGEMHMITVDPLAPPLRPYDVEQDYHHFTNLEKDCHTAARSQAKMGIELFQMRAWEVTHPELERTVFDIASERALSGAPIQEETERKDDNLSKAPDYLLPFLLAAKAADLTNPDEKSARKADRDARAAYKDRLLERIAIIKRREDDETEKLHRRQQAFSRAREHTEAAEKEFEQFVSAAEFRISILQQRIERQQLLFDVKLREMDDRLRKDPRLLIIYDPVAWKERQQELGLLVVH